VATLLPFLRLDRGLQQILVRTDDTGSEDERKARGQRLDNYEELAIRRQHLALTYGCRDDLDLYLKLWMLWEATPDAARSKWCKETGIQEREFSETIEGERKKLLGSIMDWRKAERRPILVEKIDALRALIAQALWTEIYQLPLRSAQELETLGFVDWESYFEEADHYQEYQDDFDIDPTAVASAAQGAGPGVFQRYACPSGSAQETDLVEVAPISLCSRQPDLDLFVACERKSNFLRPARAKSLALNIVRLKREWLPMLRPNAQDAQRVERALFYAKLSRQRHEAELRAERLRLFLPWAAPFGTTVRGAVENWNQEQGGRLSFNLPPRPEARELLGNLASQPIAVNGWLNRHELGPGAAPSAGQVIEARVIGYDQTAEGEPLLLLTRRAAQTKAFHDFAQAHHPGDEVKVYVVEMLPDPLGRRPVFVVRDTEFGLDIPMTAGDFCGYTHYQPYFGMRFEVGRQDPPLKAQVVEIDGSAGQVRLSRLPYLLDEYASVPAEWDGKVEGKHVIVERVDAQGVYLSLRGDGPCYIGFVRRALWPPDFEPRPGTPVEARVRRYERSPDVAAWRERLSRGEDLPSELDLGIELDLRLPKAYEKFIETHRGRPRGKKLFDIPILRPLDSGALLLDLGSGLVGFVYADELELDGEGHLRRAQRDYKSGQRLEQVLVTRVDDKRARVLCSLFRLKPLPAEVPSEAVVRVLAVQQDRAIPDRWHITCSWKGAYRVKVQAHAQRQHYRIDETLTVQLRVKNPETNELSGTPIELKVDSNA